MGQVPQVNYLLVGGGRLARHLHFYLRSLDLALQTWTRRELLAELESKLGQATHILLAIPDQEIESFITTNLSGVKAQIVHFSGALSTDLAVGAHPLMTFSRELYPVECYRDIAFVFDSAGQFNEVLPGLPNKSYPIEKSRKALYHAYCVMSGNFTTLLWEKFFKDLETKFAIPAAAALPYLKQITANLEKVAAAEEISVLTGPIVRGDLQTIEKNLTALDFESDRYADVYRAFLPKELL